MKVTASTNAYVERYERTHEIDEVAILEDGIEGVRIAIDKGI